MPEPQTPEELRTPRWRYWGDRQPPKNRAEIFRVENAADEARAQSSGSTGVATIRMYGPIDSWGGFFGISAKDVATALDEVGDVSEIRLRINSPGGEVWEGLAILNMLRAHQAKVTAVVDGLAASAASFIVAAADARVMSPGTQLMIHDASAFAIGNAATMERARRMLDSISDSIASIYADSAGGTADEWRTAMREETWYTAGEAVAANLADRVAVVRDEGTAETAGEDQPAPDDVEDRFAAAAARFDLSIFAHAGRSCAPAPKLPTASAVGSTPTHGTENAMAFTPEQLTTMRQTLGLSEDADEATITAALVEHAQEAAEAVASAGSPSAAAPPAQPAAQASTSPAASPAQPAPVAAPAGTPGTMVIDVSAWDAIQERTRRLEAADARRRKEERDQVIDQAVRDGKFPVARKEHWSRLWDADPEGTRTVIDGLTKNVVPVDEIGHALDDADIDEEFSHLFPPTSKGA
jgi:ATP-dependent protease ClpP protease subunit